MLSKLIVATSAGSGSLIGALVAGLQADGVLPSLDRLWVFAQPTTALAKVDLIAGAMATLQNGPTFTPNRGYAGDGLSAYIDSNFNPSTAGGHYTRNDASYGVWVVAANTVTSGRLIGYDGFNATELRYNAASNYSMGINSASYTGTGVASTSTGLFVATRVGASGAGSQNTYYNGAGLVADNQASTALPSQNFFVLASNQGGSAIAPSDGRAGLAFIGGSLTAAQVSALYSRARTYMTAVGVP